LNKAAKFAALLFFEMQKLQKNYRFVAGTTSNPYL